MSVAAPATSLAAAHPLRLRCSVEQLRGALLWLTGFSGAFVFIEPGPYEVTSLLTILVFTVTGLALRPGIMPLVFLLTLYNIGFSIAVIPVIDQPVAQTWVMISWYLAATALFYAAMLGTNPQRRLDHLIRGYMLSAMVASIAGIVGYFHLVPALSDLFLRFDRARGTFNDPNVLGAFVVLPALLALQRVLTARLKPALGGALMLALFTAALLLSFSRGAWGQFALSAIVLVALSLATGRSAAERRRIVVVAVVGFIGLAALIAVLLSIDQVAELFRQRASLEQDYDVGHFGRFNRHILGFLLALDRPFGIGPLQFREFFPEDPHNAYLNAFMSGGWLSGICYLTLIVLTLLMGLRFILVRTPWQPAYLALYAAFVGIAGESAIIDSDHWRHFFLIVGVLWGLMAATRTFRRERGMQSTQDSRTVARAQVPTPRVVRM